MQYCLTAPSSPDGRLELQIDWCLQHGVFVPLASILIAIALAFRLHFLSKRPLLPSDMIAGTPRIMTGLKLVLVAISLALTWIDMIMAADPIMGLAWSDILASASLTIVLILAIPTHYYEWIKSRRASSQLCSNYLVLLLLFAFRLHSLLLNHQDGRSSAPLMARIAVLVFLFATENASTKPLDSRPTHAIPAGQHAPTEPAAWFLGNLYFTWVVDLLRRGREKGANLSPVDLWRLPTRLGSRISGAQLADAWVVEKQFAAATQRLPSLARALFAASRARLTFLGLLVIAQSLLPFGAPYFVEYFITFIGADLGARPPVSEGVAVSVLFFVFNMGTATVSNRAQHLLSLESLRVKTALQLLVFEKGLQLPAVGSAPGATVADTTQEEGAAPEKLSDALISTNGDDADTVPQGPAGEILNLSQVDVEAVADGMVSLTSVMSTPPSLLIALIMLYVQVGWVAIVAFVLLFAMLPAMAYFGGLMTTYRDLSLAQTDARIKTTSKLLSSIKSLRLYGWTGILRDQILECRSKEIGFLKKNNLVLVAQIVLSFLVPVFATFAVFATYSTVHPANSLTASRIFVTLSIMRILNHSLGEVVWGWMLVVSGHVSLKRLGKFLQESDLLIYVHHHPSPSAATLPAQNQTADSSATTLAAAATDVTATAPLISITDAEFVFPGTPAAQPPVLSIPSLQIERATLTAIVGAVGSGKSALLLSLLGELVCIKGTVAVNAAKIAFVAQHAFILNASVRDNITFGLPHDSTLYAAVVDACALRRDFGSLPKGDATLVGERGVALSGGQRSRISCARATYAALSGSAELILLDDPLSAVDAHVDRHMWTALFAPTTGLLRSKSVLLVTHAVQHLADTDSIILMHAGAIAEHGKYSDLMALQDGRVAKLAAEYEAKRVVSAADDEPNSQSDSDDLGQQPPVIATPSAFVGKDIVLGTAFTDTVDASGPADGSKHPGGVLDYYALSLVDDEEVHDGADGGAAEEKVSSGSVNWRVYWTYISWCGKRNVFIAIAASVISSLANMASTYWLAAWGNASDRGEGDVAYYLSGYGALMGAMAVFCVLSLGWSLTKSSIQCSKATLSRVLEHVLRCPQSFFDTTPSGRILNRFSADQNQIDFQLADTWDHFSWTLLDIALAMIAIAVATPWFALALVPVLGLFLLLQRVYLDVSREVQRLSSILQSPVYTHVAEMVHGLVTVRAFGHESRFARLAEMKFDAASAGKYNLAAINRWSKLFLEVLANFIIIGVTLTAVLSPSVNPAIMAVALNFSFDIVTSLSLVFGLYGTLENALVSVERLKEYTVLPTEAPATMPLDESLSPNWPEAGRVVFENLSAAYRPELSLVLRNVSVDIPPGSKVGVVGRTGAGKSSLSLCLFRVIEATSGSIQVDGIDISHLGLDVLRARLTILPQDPTILDTSVRGNIDPLSHHDDATLWAALTGSHLADYVRTLEGGLDAPVTSSSLSVGQAALLCLARAILRKSRVLVLDEATASIDHQTDDIVQKTIRREFEGCTVITIAHRLATILDYDYILCLDGGQVVEFDTPAALLADPSTLFYSLAAESRLV
ncbi:hypothetical protein BC828DRAFT_248449 [Blastocladiella britannica]|nr:hypothetical protein BC828DRAFT_248449 [Blastocladiella britannica]